MRSVFVVIIVVVVVVIIEWCYTGKKKKKSFIFGMCTVCCEYHGQRDYLQKGNNIRLM